ncbi:hypothetical protein [uncultured Jatrophihabitans sp.]|uniref:hypothetical protein n=1 Tax=uncultured Jatrophihabitans sp. TaxID=1610747 RepID=UPI0035C9E03C
MYENGQVVSTTVVPTPFPIVGGDTYHVATTASGSTIRTTINGVLVDSTSDSTFGAGRVGFREGDSDGESARFDNVRVTAPDGQVLLSDDFSGDLNQWARPAPIVKGTSISATSCGGQPDDVATLSGPNGPLYLYTSDRWNNGVHNQSPATTYWEPLRFTADGAIRPLTCASTYRVALPTGGPVRPATDPGFHSYCDIGGTVERMQSFTATRGGVLRGVDATLFQARPADQNTTGQPDQPLTLRLVRLQPDGTPGRTLATRAVTAPQVSWSPSWLGLPAHVRVHRGEQLAVILSSTTGTGCYGVAYSDDGPAALGQESYSSDGGTTWRVETGRRLHVRAVIR